MVEWALKNVLRPAQIEELKESLAPNVIQLVDTDILEEVFELIHMLRKTLHKLVQQVWLDLDGNTRLKVKSWRGLGELLFGYDRGLQELLKTLVNVSLALDNFPFETERLAQQLYDDSVGENSEQLALAVLQVLYVDGLLDKEKFTKPPADLSDLPIVTQFQLERLQSLWK